MKISFLMENVEYRAPDRPRGQCQWAVLDGLRALGHEVVIDIPTSGPDRAKFGDFDCAFVWNGHHGQRGESVGAFRKYKTPIWIMERGFFRRMEYTQLDTRGFNHRASWADTLTEPAPLEGRGRFEASWGAPVVPMAPRDSGYVLILGQVPGDTQLAESEISHPKPLIRAVAAALPAGIDLQFRAHPLYNWRTRGLPCEPCAAPTLQEAVAGARFCVTINSNAGNEALAWGCPVLALGPVLGSGCSYPMPGINNTTVPLNCLDGMLDLFLGSFSIKPETATNHLYHLACHQYSMAELRNGWALRKLGF